jgi:hypothetical protein
MKYRKDWALALSALLLVTAIRPLWGAPPESAGQASTPYTPPFLNSEPAGPGDGLFDRFFASVLSSDAVVFDNLANPSAQLSRIQQQNSLGYGAVQNLNAQGAQMFRHIALDSLRTSAIEFFPLSRWQDYWLGPLAGLFSGTIGNAEEERMRLDSSSYSAVRLSWESAGEQPLFQWGVRPWRTSPYAYFMARAGHQGGLPLITLEGRAGYKLFGATKLEGRLTLQLPNSFRIAGSGSFEPTSNNSSDRMSAHFGVMLERVLTARAHRPEAVLYVGLSSDIYRSAAEHSGACLVAGLARRW